MIQLKPEPKDRRSSAQREDDAALLVSEFTEDLRDGCGMPETEATQLALKLVHRFRLRHGARRIYVPAVDKTERDAAIRRDFKGTNAAELCRQHGISRTRLYEIAGRRSS
jgi:Mor family transcriptional regulator